MRRCESEKTMTAQKDVIVQEFDAVAPAYENNRLSEWYKAHAKEMLTVINPEAGSDVVDIGCGTGYFLRQLCEQSTGLQCTGVDISAQMVHVAREYARREDIEEITYIEADWEDMNLSQFGRGRPALITCANAFHYFADPRAALEKMYQLLAEDGRLLILERDKSHSLLTSVWAFLHDRLIRDHVIFYKEDELCRLLEAAGFANIKIVKRIKRYFWKKKLFTSIVLIECHKSSKAQA